MKRLRASLCGVALAAALAACGNLGEDRLLSVLTTGTLQGLVYLDVNGNRIPDAGDTTVLNLRVSLVSQTSGDTVASALAEADGSYTMDDVPVGTYRVVADSSLLLDTAVIDRIDSSQVTVTPDDTTRVDVVVSYPRLSIAAARLLPVGRKVFIEGIVLNALNTFRDTTMHVQDNTAAIRATRVFNVAVAPGDSVRLRGTISRRPATGTPQPTIDLVTVFSLGSRFLPAASQLSTLQASSAMSGTLDARQAQVLNVTISDTAAVGPDWRLTVNDAASSGTLEVLLDATSNPTFAPAVARGIYVPGERFDIVGVLVPTGVAGLWRLKPRSPQDLLPL